MRKRSRLPALGLSAALVLCTVAVVSVPATSAVEAGSLGETTMLYELPEGAGTLNDIVALEDGSTYIADGSEHVVRRISPDGSQAIVAGSTAADVFVGEGGPALSAVLPEPSALAVAPDGTIYIGSVDRAVRAVDPATGIISTILGVGYLAADQKGPLPGTSFPLRVPNTLSVASDGSLLVLDSDLGNQSQSRLVRLAGGFATQVTGGGVIQEGPGAAGFGWDSLVSVAGVAAGPNGAIWVTDYRSWLYSGTLDGIASVRRGLGWPYFDLGFLPGGDRFVGPMRLRSDGSADLALWASGLVPSMVVGYAQTSNRVLFLTPTSVRSRSVPALLKRPPAPTGSVIIRSGGGARAIAVSGLTPTQSVVGYARPGLANPATSLGDGDLGLYVDPGNVVVLDQLDDEVGWGHPVTVSVWTFDQTTGTYSIPTSWSLDNYLPITCPVTPSGRRVPYNTGVSVKATVTSALNDDTRSMVEGAWRIAPGGLASTSYPAAATAADGTTSRKVTIRRTTRVTYSVSRGILGPCSASVTYTVVPTLTSSLSKTSAYRGTSFAVRVALTSPQASGEPVVLQRRSGTSWVTVKSGSTGSTGAKTFWVTAPARPGIVYYRVVKPRTAAYGSATGKAMALTVR